MNREEYIKALKRLKEQLNDVVEWEEKNPVTGASMGGGRPTQGIHFNLDDN